MVDVVTAILTCAEQLKFRLRLMREGIKKPDELNKIGNKKQ